MDNKSIQVDELRKKIYLALSGIQLGEDAEGNDYYLDPSEHDEAIDKLEALIQQKQLETAKAYGGCTKCYGKGYATHIDATTAYADFGDEFGGAQSQKTIKHEMLFCTCERGKQLEVLLSTPPKKEEK